MLNDIESLLLEGLDSSPDCFAIIDDSDNVVYCNHQFAALFMLKKNEVIGKRQKDILFESWKKKRGVILPATDFEDWWNSVLEKGRLEGTHQFEIHLVDDRWFKMTRLTLESGNVLELAIEITENKHLQTSLEKAYKTIENQAHTDQLTGAYNRRLFEKNAQIEFKRAKRYHDDLSLILLDIDFFKMINDTHGHQAGDEVLIQFSELCSKTLREVDSFYRIGGEEFVVLLPKTNLSNTLELAERIRKIIERHDFLISSNNIKLKVTASGGLCQLSTNDTSIDSMLSTADRRLYAAKQSGRNVVIDNG